jgi:uncharacterized protein YqjF (DUF2071 family)
MRSGAERGVRLGSDAVATVTYNVGVPDDSASPTPLSLATPALTARWMNLVLLTYEVPEKLLRSHIHPSLKLDRWNGQTHISLVAFDFQDTRLFGWRIPGFVNFPEVNLRTYVRHGDERGVVFIRELVTSPIIAFIARAWYNEPYRAVPLWSQVEEQVHEVSAHRRWRVGGSAHQIRVVGSATSWTPATTSLEHHFKEHEWGFGRSRSGRLLRYRVQHPCWSVRQITSSLVQVGFATTYGERWGFLDHSEPISMIFAVGSEVAVHPARLVY